MMTPQQRQRVKNRIWLGIFVIVAFWMFVSAVLIARSFLTAVYFAD